MIPIGQELGAMRLQSPHSLLPSHSYEPQRLCGSFKKQRLTSRLEVVSAGTEAIIVGGGWGGLGAARALIKAGADVTLVESADTVGGLSTACRSAGGRTVEPGIKGFWHQYRNIEALLRELRLEHVLTAWTSSSFYSPAGLQVTAPIFKDLVRLPTPIGSFLYTAPYFTDLPLTDRLTAVRLLGSLLEHDLDAAAYAYYDSISARELFSRVSPKLYRDFLEPILLVTLFATGDRLSAAAALGCLYFFALGHQADFDVRWCKGPVGELIVKPWAEQLATAGVTFMTQRRVQAVSRTAGEGWRIETEDRSGLIESLEADAVILSAPIPALQRIVEASPQLRRQPDFARLAELEAIDIMAVRLWLDRRIEMGMPSNIAVGFDTGVGATVFDLSVLQPAHCEGQGSVVEIDFYNATPLLCLSDEEVLDRALNVYLGMFPSVAGTAVIDSSIIRAPRAVTAFTPGSGACLPPIATSLPGIFMAGDFVAQGPGTHGAKGLSQEKAYVAGLQAGNQAAERMGLKPVARVVPAENDEPHVQFGKQAYALRRQLARALVPT